MTSRTGQANRRRHAFTLLELMLVLALVAGLMAASTPALRGMLHGRRADEEAKRLLALFHWAPIEAASRGEMLFVWINPELGEYGLMTANETQDERFRGSIADSIVLVIDAESIGADGICTIVARPEGRLHWDTPSTIELIQPGRNQSVVIDYDTETDTFALTEPL